MSLSKKSKLIIGGGVTLAILAAIGAGVGVVLGSPSTTTPTEKKPIEKPVEKNVKSRVLSFLDVGLEEDSALKTEITNLAIKYDTENENIEATAKSLAAKIKEYLNKHLEVIKTKITEMEANEDRSFFPEIDKKVTELKAKQSSLETLISDETYVGKFLNGEESLDKIQAVVFDNLPRTQQGYKDLKQTYINTFTKLRDLANIQDPDAGTNIFTATLDSITTDATRDYIIRETNNNNLIKNFVTNRLLQINPYLEALVVDDIDKYSDVKTSYDKLVSVKASIDELTTYLSSIDNLQAMLEDETLLNTKFQLFNEKIEVTNKDILDKYTSNREDINTRSLVLTNIITTIGANSAIKSSIGVTDEDVTLFTNQATSISDGTLTLDKSIETLENLENSFFEKVKTYENIGTKTEQIKTALIGLAETDADYISLKPIYDYFSNKETVLKDLSSSEGLVKFQAQVVKIKGVVISDATVKESIKNKIDELLALTLTPNKEITDKLNAYKTELDSVTAVIADVEAKINTEVQKYLTVHVNAIKAEIAKYQNLRVFDDVDAKLNTLTNKQTALELLNTATIWNDITSGTTTITQIGTSSYTTLTREPTSYNEDLTKYKASLLHLKTKFENISVETQTSIQTIHDALDAGTSKISEVLSEVKTLLISFVTPKITELNTLLDSVPAADRNLYTDVKTIFDSITAAKTTFETTKTHLETEGNINTLLLSSTTDIDSNVNIPSDIENKALVEDFATNKESLKTRAALLTAIKAALGQTWITSITDFLPTKATLITDITTHEAITTYEGLLTKTETLETKIYNEILKYKNADGKLTVIKTEIDSLASTPTDQTYIKLKEIYDYLKNENGVLKDVSTETGVNKLIENINKLNDPTEFGRSLILKLNMYIVSTNTPTGDNREKLLDDAEFKLIETIGFYCGGTTHEEANTKLQASVKAFQESQTYVLKPHSIKANSNFKVTLPKYRDQENVEVDCWEVEVAEDYPTLSKQPLTQEEGYKYAIVRSNSNKQFIADGDTAANGIRLKKMVEEAGVYCEIGVATTAAKVATFYPNYEPLGAADYAGANIKGSFIYSSGGAETTTVDAYCFKMFNRNTPEALAEKTKITKKINDLLAVPLSYNTEVRTELENLRTELNTPTADIPDVRTRIEAKIKEYLESYVATITNRITQYETNGLEVFNEVKLKITELKAAKVKIEAIITDTIGSDIIEGTTTIDSISATIVNNLSRTVDKYKTVLANYITNLNNIQEKFKNIPGSKGLKHENQIRAIKQQLESKTININETVIKTKETLVDYFTSFEEKITSFVNSIPEEYRNKYTDITTLINTVTERKVSLNNDDVISDLLTGTKANIDSKLSDIGSSNSKLFDGFNNYKHIFTFSKVFKAFETGSDNFWFHIEDFLPTKAALLTEITTLLDSSTTFQGILDSGSLETLETKIYNEVLKYKDLTNRLVRLKAKIDDTTTTRTKRTELNTLYTYFTNKNTVLNDIADESTFSTFRTNVTSVIIETEAESVKDPIQVNENEITHYFSLSREDQSNTLNDGGLVCFYFPGSTTIISSGNANYFLTLQGFQRNGQTFKVSGNPVDRWHNGRGYKCWRTVLRTETETTTTT